MGAETMLQDKALLFVLLFTAVRSYPVLQLKLNIFLCSQLQNPCETLLNKILSKSTIFKPFYPAFTNLLNKCVNLLNYIIHGPQASSINPTVSK